MEVEYERWGYEGGVRRWGYGRWGMEVGYEGGV